MVDSSLMQGRPGTAGLNVAVVANSSWYVLNFRANLIRSLQAAGHRVVTMASDDAHTSRLTTLAPEHCSIPFSGTGTNPLREARAVFALRRAFKRNGIDVVLSYTPKGNVYSAIALAGMPARLVVNVSGLGRAFASNGLLRATVELLYQRTFSRAQWVFFQNDEDRRYFVERKLVKANSHSRLPGSGVDLAQFSPRSARNERDIERPVHFLLVSRMLWDKGIGEFVGAARLVRHSRPDVVFRLLGSIDAPSASAVPKSTIEQWQAEGCVEYLGSTDDVAACLSDADCVVLPSTYREGVPRCLLEAAAMAKPIITTDSVGCRDTVDEGASGYICRPKDTVHLADRMLQFIALSHGERERMGQLGRQKMERQFDERIVINMYLDLLDRWRPPTMDRRVLPE